MGLINNKKTTLDNGLDISNTYVSIERLKIEKDSLVQPAIYRIGNRATEHVSREKKYEGKPMLSSINMNFDLEELPSTIEELYTKAYNAMREYYRDTSDVIE
jgi:predicted acyltransferase (DUF342 family)